WVDQHDILGLGPNTPIGTGNFSDSLHALTYGKVVQLRVPYPMGFFAKGVDGRIDDPNGGWKRRGLWVTSGNRTPMPIEGIDAPDDTKLLWVLRERLRMTGTKFGCGMAQCGACTVHLNGDAVRSCQVTLAQAAGKKITTIEGLHPQGQHPLQVAWIAEQVPQCGYCQSGQIMQAAAL